MPTPATYLRWLVRLEKEIPDGLRIIGHTFRTSFVVGHRSSVGALIVEIPGLAEDAWHLQLYRMVYFRHGDRWAQQLAMVRLDRLVYMVDKSSADQTLKMAARDELLWQRRTLDNGELMLSDAATITRLGTEGRRRAQAVTQIVQRAGNANAVLLLANKVEAGVLDLVRGVPSPQRTLLLRYLGIVDLSEIDTWVGIYKKLHANVKSLEHPPGMSFTAFRTAEANRGQISSVKGLLQEEAFWRSAAWIEAERDYARYAWRRARLLARGFSTPDRPFKVYRIKEPLYVVGEEAGEIYDGAQMILRESTNDPDVMEGFLDLAVQIKAEIRVTVGEQILRDLSREGAEGVTWQLRTLNGKKSFILGRAPDGDNPARLMFAPRHPGKGQMTELPAGIETRFTGSLMDADELGEIAAYLLFVAS